MYWWKGKIEEGREFVLIVKTSKEKAGRVRTEIEIIHPAETSCIIKLDVDPNEKYWQWIKSELK